MIIGYKKGIIKSSSGLRLGYCLVELEILGAIVKAVGQSKMRTSKARVLSIKKLDFQNKETELKIASCSSYKTNDKNFYVEGVTVIPDSFSDSIGEDCGHGIHFFLDKDSARRYEM